VHPHQLGRVDLVVRQACLDGFKGDARFEAGQQRPEAKVRALAEGEMLARVPGR